MIDDKLLALTDRFGDWYQEERGGELLRLLYGLVYVVAFVEAFWIMSLLVFTVEEKAWVFTAIVSLWSAFFMLSVWAVIHPRLKEMRSDFDRFDEEGVRKKYQDKALKRRAFGGGPRTFVVVITPPIVLMNGMAIYQDGRVEAVQLLPIIFFALDFLKEYAECIMPKVPRVRKELKLATAGAGTGPF